MWLSYIGKRAISLSPQEASSQDGVLEGPARLFPEPWCTQDRWLQSWPGGAPQLTPPQKKGWGSQNRSTQSQERNTSHQVPGQGRHGERRQDDQQERKQCPDLLQDEGQKWGNQKMQGCLQGTLSLQPLSRAYLKEAHQKKSAWYKAVFSSSSPGASPNRWLLTNLHPGNAIIAPSICPVACLHKYTMFFVWTGIMMLRL